MRILIIMHIYCFVLLVPVEDVLSALQQCCLMAVYMFLQILILQHSHLV